MREGVGNARHRPPARADRRQARPPPEGGGRGVGSRPHRGQSAHCPCHSLPKHEKGLVIARPFFITYLIYIAAALAEIAGCFSFWAWWRLEKSPLWLAPGL
ncbi:hypothetical protein EN779_11935, partial [Mesorhizobium sp. M4B.F.Ca.ET.088.02.2.1]